MSDYLGEKNGVSVVQLDSGDLAVEFAYDSVLRGMMDKVAGATFNKDDGRYIVPAASEPTLGKVVKEMRAESLATDSALAHITELAKQSGLKAQELANVDGAPEPKVSSFINANKPLLGEIVNVNSRFAAQLTGLGAQDGAAFVMIHRLANLNRPTLEKGDSVAITYDAYFNGVVSNFQKTKSADELMADHAANLGTEVDGVTVTDRGNKVGVVFDLHPVMLGRIQKLDGAAFNKDDKVWEIGKDKLSFVLWAVDDMRREFVASTKEVEALKQVAESKIDGAKVVPAFTRDGFGFSGIVAAVGDRYALQKTGQDKFTLHHLSALDQTPVKDRLFDIKYNKGVGHVLDVAHMRAQSQNQGR